MSSRLIAFCLTCLVVELSPGPNMTYLALLSVQKGRGAGFAATIGVATGLAGAGLASGFGLSEIIAASPTLYQALRWGGVAYFFYLAWEAWHTDTKADSTDIGTGQRYFVRGLLANLLSPKAFVFFAIVLPPFMNPAAAPERQTLILSAIYISIASAIHVIIISLASTLRPMIANKGLMAATGKGFAFALAGVGFWVAWTTS
ncbi:MAG: LysE family translocator [Acidocella sp.]|nr:LysE family translocator [Acidocella sp.]